MTEAVTACGVAAPSWGTGTSGTGFARFPSSGKPASIMDGMDDCGVIHAHAHATPPVSLHIPWDEADPADLNAKAEEHGLGFDAMNSNTFQDHPGQALSYEHGSLSHQDHAVRDQAVEPDLRCTEIGRAIGSRALTV